MRTSLSSPSPTSCLHRRGPVRLLAALLMSGALAAPLHAAEPEARLYEIAQLAERDNAMARTILVREGPAMIAGAPYAIRIDFLRLLRRVQVDAGHVREAYDIDRQILELATLENDALNIALVSLAQINRQLAENAPDSALAALELVKQRYHQLDHPEYRAGLELMYGVAYGAVGQYDRALPHFLRCLDIVGRHTGLWNPRAADVRLALARMYINARDPDKALEALRDVRAGQTSLPVRTAAALAFYEGRALVVQDDPGAALLAFERALTLARANGLISVEANVLANIANANLKLQRYGPAEQAARAALAPAHASNDQNSRQMAEANLGFALFGQGRQREGLSYIDSVLDHFRDSGAKAALSRLLAEKSQALERAGSYRAALATVREREALVSELAQGEREKAISALQEEFKAKERAAQIDLLRRQNADKDAEIQDRSARQLVASLGALLILLVCAIVWLMYRKSLRTSRRLGELNAELAYRSAHDPLTGLSNRRSFQERMLSRTGETVARLDSADCFTLLDIDHFKRVNDEYGHAAGDTVLIEIGRRLRQTVRGSDMVLRWGGEEFLVYSQNVALSQRPVLVRRILDAISATPVLLDDGTALQISATAGAVSLPFEHDADGNLDWEQAIALADRALYKGKEAGRNRAYLVAGLRRPDGGVHEGLQLDLILPGAAA